MSAKQMFLALARDDHRRVMEHTRKLRDAERAQARSWKRFHADELFAAKLQRSIHLDLARLS